jgi:hypothetical protein
LFGLLLAFSIGVAAAPAPEVRTAAPGSTPPAAQLSDMKWMVGSWAGEGFGAKLQETYSDQAGGQMPGHFSIVADGKPGMYEFVMIAQVGPSLEYRVRHINPDMTAWEDKANFIRFPLVAVVGDTWYFDGLTIRRTGPDAAEHVVRVGHKGGKTEDAVLRYRRVKP